ncbi:MAG: hypothetical protein V3R64_09490 [Sphingomonadales bacterium]
MSPEIFDLYNKVGLEIEAENFQAANSILDKWQSRKGLTSYESAMSYQMRGFIAYQQENLKKAIVEYRKILQFPDIPYATTDSIRFNLAQFLSMENRFKESLSVLAEWFLYQPSPSAQQFFFKSQVHYQYGIELDKVARSKREADQQFRLGIVEVERTINMGNADPLITIRENWFQIQSALYYQLEDYSKVRDILEIVIVQWPRPQYWVQLSAMYSELRLLEKQLAVLDVAYRLGFLEKETNIVTIAQLYSINELPYLAAKVMENGMKPVMVDGQQVTLVDPEDEKNLTLLGQSYLVGRDYAKSTAPLAKAAELSEDGELYLQLGSVYNTLEDWKNAASSLQSAIDKSIVNNRRIDQANRANRNDPDYKPEKKEALDQAYLYLGVAYVNFREFGKAEKAFKDARRVAESGDKKIARQVRGWLSHITMEKQRLKRLAASGITPSG